MLTCVVRHLFLRVRLNDYCFSYARCGIWYHYIVIWHSYLFSSYLIIDFMTVYVVLVWSEAYNCYLPRKFITFLNNEWSLLYNMLVNVMLWYFLWNILFVFPCSLLCNEPTGHLFCCFHLNIGPILLALISWCYLIDAP